MFFLIFSLCIADSSFPVTKIQKVPPKCVFFIFNSEFYANFRSDGICQKRYTGKKVTPNNVFFLGQDFFGKKSFMSCLLFPGHIFLNFLSGLQSASNCRYFDAQLIYFEKKKIFSWKGRFYFLTQKHEICITEA
jgi:hypothetical protein